ncbi:hypothetical protein [Paractinoplanes durhamensis]|uniref:RING-type E3 ubiquitin transferase n=1 Tax=Paractinoplanes durhamensis TaxID=113563 RepID=A0ABQ3YSC1_9ACTN|nr:hypothetical protein [Actinoplanes durhamensis]GIE00480.1 hypothetical protein Adu01nite_18300 [Actinoplanes durhamensis]
MAVVASGILCLGVCMVLVTGIFALISASNLRLARLLRRTPPTPIGTWPARRGRVTTEATVEYGAAGPQVGPLSGKECAWYEMTLTRADRSSDTPSRHSEAGTTPAPAGLTDGSGWVAIDNRLLTDRFGDAKSYEAPPVCEVTTRTYERGSERPSWVTEKMAKSLGFTETFVMTEVRLPHGLPVFAMGRLSNGFVGPTGYARIIKGTWADLIKQTEDDLSLMTKTIPAFIAIGAIIGVAGFFLLLYVTTGHLTW